MLGCVCYVLSDFISLNKLSLSYYFDNYFMLFWFIFGDDGNSMSQSQMIPSIGSNWTLVPELYQALPVYGQCSAQVNWSKALFTDFITLFDKFILL
jgi:hypothetical protein